MTWNDENALGKPKSVIRVGSSAVLGSKISISQKLLARLCLFGLLLADGKYSQTNANPHHAKWDKHPDIAVVEGKERTNNPSVYDAKKRRDIVVCFVCSFHNVSCCLTTKN